ncbi:MAG: hypothetical protein ACRD3Q_22050 [Terriglobales bacterium]
MTPQQIVALTLRLFAIWVGLQALSWVPSLFDIGASSHQSSFVYVTFLLAANAVAVLVLWFFPRTIAGKLLSSQDTPSQLTSTTEIWLAMGCTLIGLWKLTTTVPKLAVDLFLLKSIYDRSQLDQWILYTVIELAIAAWLVLGGKGVWKLFQWAQYAGTRKDL